MIIVYALPVLGSNFKFLNIYIITLFGVGLRSALRVEPTSHSHSRFCLENEVIGMVNNISHYSLINYGY